MFPKVKAKKFQTKKIVYIKNKKELSEKDDTKTRHPQMIFYGKEVTVVIFGILTLFKILVLAVGLKSRWTELELEADIW